MVLGVRTVALSEMFDRLHGRIPTLSKGVAEGLVRPMLDKKLQVTKGKT